MDGSMLELDEIFGTVVNQLASLWSLSIFLPDHLYLLRNRSMQLESDLY